jgi:pimeloyl-ACP methyl ester carboxylesterase
VFELLKTVGPLTDPTAHGGRAEDAFDLVLPSMPGYGLSGKPTGTGWGPDRIARAWAELMKRLGYTRYVAQGGDWGAAIANAMARQAPAGLLGIHVNLPATVPPDVAAPAGLSEQERTVFDVLMTYGKKGNSAYFVMMSARPQAVGYGLTDSPAGLAAWMLVHTGFAQWTYGDDPKESPTKDEVLDDITLYLADQQRDLVGAAVLGEWRTKHYSCGRAEDRRDLVAGGHHGVSGGGLSSPGDMGPARLSQPDLLP